MLINAFYLMPFMEGDLYQIYLPHIKLEFSYFVYYGLKYSIFVKSDDLRKKARRKQQRQFPPRRGFFRRIAYSLFTGFPYAAAALFRGAVLAQHFRDVDEVIRHSVGQRRFSGIILTVDFSFVCQQHFHHILAAFCNCFV